MSNRRTVAEQELEAALDRYIVARETPGVPSERLYQRLRQALRAVKRERAREAEAV